MAQARHQFQFQPTLLPHPAPPPILQQFARLLASSQSTSPQPQVMSAAMPQPQGMLQSHPMHDIQQQAYPYQDEFWADHLEYDVTPVGYQAEPTGTFSYYPSYFQ